MKVQFVVVLLVGVFSSWVSADDVALGVPVRDGTTPPNPDCSGIYGRRCFNCTHLQLCAGVEISMQDCGNVNRNTPYCVNDGCSAAGAPKCDPPFICTADGLFPDVTDCARYYLCDKPGGTPEIFECPPQYVYDSRTGMCKRRRVTADCQTIDCQKFSGRMIVFQGDKSVLAFCPENSRTPVLYRCPDYIFSEFDPKTFQCSFKCPGEGRFADRLDCHKFYECYRSGNTYGRLHQDCGNNFMFDPTTKTCKVNDSCEPQVKPPTPSDENPPEEDNGSNDVDNQKSK